MISIKENIEHIGTIGLGKSGLKISPLGIGAWSWGGRLYWGFGREYGRDDVKQAFDTSITGGVTFFDTAESYGRGISERLLGKFVRQSNQNLVVATKFFPYPWRILKSQMISALRGSLDRLGLEQVDLYQIHWPFPPRSVETWADGLANVVESGLARAVGVSNFNIDQMQRTHQVLEKRGIPLASNQVEYHLLNREIEHNGLLKISQELDITIIAYSPLAQGVLTGKYTPQNTPPGIRGLRYNRGFLEKSQRLIKLLGEIGETHGGKTIPQVALNWVMGKGAVPIPGAKNREQADENAGAMSFQLTEDQIHQLDKTSMEAG